MSTPSPGVYSFLSWARQGLGNFINEDDPASLSLRSSIDVTLQIHGDRINGGAPALETIARNVQLYGPADVIGIDPKAIVRSEPRDWITNFEPNYLPFIEFYEEDFPWRYTPARPSAEGKLVPWITLLVLEESEWDKVEDGKRNMLHRPLRYLKVTNPQGLPNVDDLWAWAHVHVNADLSVDRHDTAALAEKLDETLSANRDQAYSRLLCPRILKENTGYDAFLIPTFETGRLAGLGRNPTEAKSATQIAWGLEDRQEADTFPYYHRWYFRTAAAGDFEYLVRLLQRRTVDPRVGRREMDTQRPGDPLRAITELGGVLRLGGALRAPLRQLSEEDRGEYDKFEAWNQQASKPPAPPHPFQSQLASLINLGAEYGSKTVSETNAVSGLNQTVVEDQDPLIVPPFYGRCYSGTPRLLPASADPSKKRWLHELNLDPRHRVTAGFGTSVVQKDQEKYMEAAWQQAGSVLDANQRIRNAQMAKFASNVWHSRVLVRILNRSRERFLTILAPLHQRVVADGLTVRQQIRESTLPTAMLSKTMRQMLRPRGRVARLLGFDAEQSPANLLSRVNSGAVKAVNPKTVPSSLPTGAKLAAGLGATSKPEHWRKTLERFPWLSGISFVRVFIDGAISINKDIKRGKEEMEWVVRVLRGEVDSYPASSGFDLTDTGQVPPPGDSPDAVRFKESLRNIYEFDRAQRELKVVDRKPLQSLTAIASNIRHATNPERTIPRRVLKSIQIPDHIRRQLRESFGEVMVYPRIDQPMYEPLKEISTELFLPNINLIPNNSITLLETNRKFVESYMVGLNHEFARELLWREYPTDQRGSYFRQFWDVRGFLPAAGADPEATRESLYDIPKLHRWLMRVELGEHNNRSQAEGETLVLVIRGELLKKYPTAVIYAHRAEWDQTSDGKTKRKLKDFETDASAVKSPLYEAKVDPDIYFFGFDLTEAQASGTPDPGSGTGDPGWFFVIEERPGEPRFGLDLPKPNPRPTVDTWNDLSWSDVTNSFTPGAFLGLAERGVTITDAPDSTDPQHVEDTDYKWGATTPSGDAATTSAELAYILCQVPVLIAFHASDMLKQAR
ncbi:MAG: hypothetical protein H7Z16_00245 [Pyrinomonadaceae bacterium]|nr:hypothetical protein [Pyrinomonadaceae bacterium]